MMKKKAVEEDEGGTTSGNGNSDDEVGTLCGNYLDARTRSEGSARIRSFPFSCACSCACINVFLVKTEHAVRASTFFELSILLSTNQSARSIGSPFLKTNWPNRDKK